MRDSADRHSPDQPDGDELDPVVRGGGTTPEGGDGEEVADAQDLADDVDRSSMRVDRRLLTSPTVLRALGGVVISVLALVWPERTAGLVMRLLGAGLVIGGASAVMSGLPRSRRDIGRASLGVTTVLCGLVLVVVGPVSTIVIAEILAVILLFIAIRDLVLVGRFDRASRRWVIARSLALLTATLVLGLFPTEILAVAITFAALAWLIVSTAVIVASLEGAVHGRLSYADSLVVITEWLARRTKTPEERRALYDKILFDGAATRERVWRFVALMSFASIIAATGVIADSTAVVIGAMLIAPLMTPLMGMAISLVMGWPRRLGRSAAVAVTGIGLAIAIGVMAGLMSPTVIQTTVNSQIVSRSSPTIIDLATALAAGAAGAFGLASPKVSDALPGVAIAISLVPPLSVVGICLSQTDFVSATGAMLLFLTNMIAILIAGGLTFVVTGVTPLRQMADNQHRVRTAVAGLAALAAIVLGALLVNGLRITTNAARQSTIESTVVSWLGSDSDHDISDVTFRGHVIDVTVVGPSSGLPSTQSLANDLAQALGTQVDVHLSLVVEERDSATAGP